MTLKLHSLLFILYKTNIKTLNEYSKVYRVFPSIHFKTVSSQLIHFTLLILEQWRSRYTIHARRTYPTRYFAALDR